MCRRGLLHRRVDVGHAGSVRVATCPWTQRAGQGVVDRRFVPRADGDRDAALAALASGRVRKERQPEAVATLEVGDELGQRRHGDGPLALAADELRHRAGAVEHDQQVGLDRVGLDLLGTALLVDDADPLERVAHGRGGAVAVLGAARGSDAGPLPGRRPGAACRPGCMSAPRRRRRSGRRRCSGRGPSCSGRLRSPRAARRRATGTASGARGGGSGGVFASWLLGLPGVGASSEPGSRPQASRPTARDHSSTTARPWEMGLMDQDK